MNNKTLLSLSVAAIISTAAHTAQAAVVTANWNGLYTFFPDLTVNSNVFMNVSNPYYSDPTWGYGLRTQISGSLTYDTNTGVGTASVMGFQWGNAGVWQIHDLALQAAGDGSGGSGNLIEGNFLYDWNGNTNVPGSIVWDASGFLAAGPYTAGQTIAGTGALPASDGVALTTSGIVLPIGPAPFASTTIDTVNPLTDDGFAGTMQTSIPYPDASLNIDITSMTIVSVSEVPLPASVWLLAMGMTGLIGMARRRVRS